MEERREGAEEGKTRIYALAAQNFRWYLQTEPLFSLAMFAGPLIIVRSFIRSEEADAVV